MIFLTKYNSYKNSAILLSICLFITLYFIIQAFTGQYSITTLKQKKTELKKLINEYEVNQADLILYEQKIKSLDLNNLDLDVLEGEMKKQIYYTKPNEVMVILPPSK